MYNLLRMVEGAVKPLRAAAVLCERKVISQRLLRVAGWGDR